MFSREKLVQNWERKSLQRGSLSCLCCLLTTHRLAFLPNPKYLDHSHGYGAQKSTSINKSYLWLAVNRQKYTPLQPRHQAGGMRVRLKFEARASLIPCPAPARGGSGY